MNLSPLLEEYERRVLAEALVRDPAQETVLARLAQLQQALERHAARGWFLRKRPHPRGLYLWGGVGSGKSMLADMFFGQVQTPKKRRVHFHAFMQEVHGRIHRLRKTGETDNPVFQVAREIAAENRLLYLDEFQVQDVADAMILAQLFSTLFKQDVTIVITSNREPKELYRYGLQRDRFLRFVTLLQEYMDVVRLESAEDYRLRQLRALKRTYFTPLGPAADRFLSGIKEQFGQGGEATHSLEVHGREVKVRTLDAKTALFTFQELCAQPLGAGDYLSIAQAFEIVILSGIPKMTRENRNEAKRFVTLIDTLYEQKAKLVATADAPPHQLYPSGDGAFEFERTASRLVEMQSERYLGTSHLG